jgi:cell division protein FtsN
MSRDYKNVERKGSRHGNGSSLLVGILIGLALGLAIALGVAWYINRMPSPFSVRSVPPRTEPTRPGAPPAVDEKAAKAGDSKQRFDFYKILPGADEASSDRPKEGQKPSTGQAKEAFFLQAGAFTSAPEADNMKARLALLGFEATIQTSPAQDKGLWHRVRVGPYTSVDELNRTREMLKQNGIQTTLVKQQEAEK